MDETAFTGTWHCRYWYPSNEHDGEDVSEYDMDVHQQGNELVFQSTPREDGAYMLVRLAVDDNLATGSWHENSAPNGAFKGAMYSGAGQLIVSDDKRRMDGQWAGIGFDHELNKSRIYSGKWEIVRTDA